MVHLSNPNVSAPLGHAAAAGQLTSFPNPARSATTLSVAMPQAGATSLEIYDISGRLVHTLVRGTLTPGQHQIDWEMRDDDGRLLRNGVYFAGLVVDGERTHHKVTLAH